MAASAATEDTFKFKEFSIVQSQCAMKVGTDGILLGAWSDVGNVERALDIGTGTGLIALMIAQRTDQAIIDAVEIDENSCDEAQENFQNSPWSKRLSTHNVSIQDYNSDAGKYDLIVCNPPFFSGGTLSSNADKNSVRHTIKLSHNDLLRSVRSLITPKGIFSVILPKLEGLRFIEIARSYGFHLSKKTDVKSRPSSKVERLLLEFSIEKKDVTQNELEIYKDDSDKWADSFRELTKDFYLKS